MFYTRIKKYALLAGCICCAWMSKGQIGHTISPGDKLYLGTGIDGLIFSTAILQTPGSIGADEGRKGLTPLRFSGFFHLGLHLNYDASTRLGYYTGIGLKNIGFIQKFESPDSTVKRRLYTLGVPVGMKIGDLIHRKFVFFGAGGDVALNYREKGFTDRGDKEKFSEWFSERTPLFLPYVFAGLSVEPGITFKLQYYPTNFLNEGFVNEAGERPYAGYNANLLMLSIGLEVHYRKSYSKEVK